MNYPTQTDNPQTATTFNGWANHATWNIALYIQNDWALYCLAREWVTDRRDSGYDYCDYDVFRHIIRFDSCMPVSTPDGVRWDDSNIDVDEMNEMLWEL